MACQRFSALPSSPSVLVGNEIVPNTDSVNVDRKATTGAIAQAATGWLATTTYVKGHYVVFNDNIYRAVQNNLNQSPLDNPTNWKYVLIVSGTTLNVPGDYATINSALAALSDAVIADNMLIQVEDGAYNYTTTQIDLSHPYGQFITIQGNTGTPASCSVSFSALLSPPSSPYLDANSGSIYASSPSGVTINGFSILKSGGAPAFGHCGILASDGAAINVGPNMIVNGFYADLAALNGGLIVSEAGLALTTVASAYGLLADNATIQAPGVAIGGPGDAVSVQRGGRVRINNSTIDAAISIFVTMIDGTVEATSSTVGNVDIFYEVQGSVNVINDGGVTYGTAAAYQIGLSGTLNYNGAIVTASAQTFPRSLIATETVQLITSATESVFLDTNGVNTAAQDLALAANGNTGVIIDSATGAVGVPVSLEVGSTSPYTGLQGGSGVLDAAGVLTVIAAWVTANTIIVPEFNDATATGPRLQSVITPATSFTLTSGAGAADVGKAVRWHAIVYP